MIIMMKSRTHLMNTSMAFPRLQVSGFFPFRMILLIPNPYCCAAKQYLYSLNDPQMDQRIRTLSINEEKDEDVLKESELAGSSQSYSNQTLGKFSASLLSLWFLTSRYFSL